MAVSITGPQRPPSFIFELVRTRLMCQLVNDIDQSPKLVSVVAPVGYGKTVLMSALFEALVERGEHCLWLGLDERHTTVERFLSCFDSGQNSLGHSVMDLMRGGAPIERQLGELLDFLADLPPITMFIDNLNACPDERLGVILDGLIFRTGSSLRLIWSSTSEPDFNVGRARLEGLVRQVSAKDLSLTCPEVAEMFGAALSHRLGGERIDGIVARTEGWPAAIRLMQIVLTESEQPLDTLDGFSGTDEDIVSLLKRQVMGRFSAELQHFLLRLALLRNFTQDLCRQAIDSLSASEYLRFLLRRNVFMIPLDRNRERYRLHNMFREFLLTEANRLLAPEEKHEVLRRAALWCESRREWQDAVDYALAAGELEHCRQLLDSISNYYVREQHNVQQFLTWVQQFEDLGGTLGIQAHFWYVWALVFQRRHQFGRVEMERLAAKLTESANSAEKESLSLRVMHLRLCLELFTDNLSACEAVIKQWLAMDNDSDAYSSGSVRCAHSICLTARFEFIRSRQVMLTARPYFIDVGGPYSLGWISLIEGVTSASEGSVASGYRELTSALSRTKKELGGEAQISCALASVASYCAVEMGEFADARQLLTTVLPNFESNVLVDHAAFGLEAALKLWDGSSSWQVSIDPLRALARSYPPRLSLLFSCFLIQRLVFLGDIQRAEAEARAINLEGDIASREIQGVHLRGHPGFESAWMAARLSLMIARRQFRSASTLIARQLGVLRSEHRYARLLELELASASISVHLGKLDLATKALTSAVRRAATRRLLRAFFDHRDVVGRLVGSGSLSARSFALPDESQFFEELCTRLGIHAATQADSPAPALPEERVEPPTEREAELLSLLSTGLSNAEIAGYTNLSVTTVKWHLKNLYRKLGVGNRAGALARARRLGLLAP